MRRVWLVVAVVGLCSALALAACKKPSSTESTTPPTRRSEQGTPRPSRPSGAEIACRLHSCAPPYYCNQSTGLCELLPCGADKDCPYGYTCDFSRNVCQ
jgi:hypothetical protein